MQLLSIYKRYKARKAKQKYETQMLLDIIIKRVDLMARWEEIYEDHKRDYVEMVQLKKEMQPIIETWHGWMLEEASILFAKIVAAQTNIVLPHNKII